MLRGPTRITSTASASCSAYAASVSSVTTGSPVSARASSRITSASVPRPWNENGDVRGLNAPPRSIVACGSTARATASVCSRDSTVHGPAIRQNGASPPTPRPFTSTVVASWWLSSLDASLYGRLIGITWSTPGIPSSASARTPSGSPIAPIAVVSSPGMTLACTPAASSRSTTAAISASPACGVITTITARRAYIRRGRRSAAHLVHRPAQRPRAERPLRHGEDAVGEEALVEPQAEDHLPRRRELRHGARAAPPGHPVAAGQLARRAGEVRQRHRRVGQRLELGRRAARLVDPEAHRARRPAEAGLVVVQPDRAVGQDAGVVLAAEQHPRVGVAGGGEALRGRRPAELPDDVAGRAVDVVDRVRGAQRDQQAVSVVQLDRVQVDEVVDLAAVLAQLDRRCEARALLSDPDVVLRAPRPLDLARASDLLDDPVEHLGVGRAAVGTQVDVLARLVADHQGVAVGEPLSVVEVGRAPDRLQHPDALARDGVLLVGLAAAEAEDVPVEVARPEQVAVRQDLGVEQRGWATLPPDRRPVRVHHDHEPAR